MEFRANCALEDDDAAGNGGLITAGPEQKRAFILPNTPEAELVVQRVVDHMRGEGIDAEGIVLEGRPDELIVAVAKERDADLIVTGSHGRTGLERILLGSTVERILNETSCAVLVVKA